MGTGKKDDLFYDIYMYVVSNITIIMNDDKFILCRMISNIWAAQDAFKVKVKNKMK